jgi:NADH:ubiquinone oxidoreductase subunit F (NADH-binding)
MTESKINGLEVAVAAGGTLSEAGRFLTRISEGQGTMEDLATLEEIARLGKETSVCGLGKTASNPVLTAFCAADEGHARASATLMR